MATNVQKTPFARSLNSFAQRKILDYMQRVGKSLPCHVVAVSGSIVTVAFDVDSQFTLPQVTMPEFGPEWIRYPTQIGDKGATVAVDTYLGGISALGGGVADLTLRANLSALFFMPIASKAWSPTDDANAVVIYGPNGGILRTRDKNHVLTVNENGITVVSTVNVKVTAPEVNVHAPSSGGVSKLTLDAFGTGFVIDGIAQTISTYATNAGSSNPSHPPEVPT